MDSVVVGDQGSHAGCGELPVVPDGGGHGQQSPGDAGADAGGGAAAVAFEAGLVFEGVVDRFDPLADAAEVAEAAAFVLAVGAGQQHTGLLAGVAFDVPPGQALSASAIIPGRSAPRWRAWARSSAATSRSPILGPARHQATGIPSPVASTYSFRPQYQREWAAQRP